ncbi:RNA methyltransferase, RsmD family [gut metagenome]|uniref:RNA methyltransferase, RsmD family n=1 Tax=gut metagenome TaxID=749906 RepID=J9GZ16_9ZZZZ
MRIVEQNCHAAGVQKASRIICGGAEVFLASAKEEFDIILLDPPYRRGMLEKILPQIARIARPGGTVLCESETALKLPEECGGLTIKKQHRYGTVLVTRYEKEREE